MRFYLCSSACSNNCTESTLILIMSGGSRTPPAPWAPEWVRQQEERLGSAMRRSGAADATSEARWRALAQAAPTQGAASSTAAAARGAGQTSASPYAVPPAMSELLKRVRLDTSLTSAAFAPDRYTRYIMGRPVQVHSNFQDVHNRVSFFMFFQVFLSM